MSYKSRGEAAICAATGIWGVLGDEFVQIILLSRRSLIIVIVRIIARIAQALGSVHEDSNM